MVGASLATGHQDPAGPFGTASARAVFFRRRFLELTEGDGPKTCTSKGGENAEKRKNLDFEAGELQPRTPNPSDLGTIDRPGAAASNSEKRKNLRIKYLRRGGVLRCLEHVP